MLKSFDLLAPRTGQRGGEHHCLNRINTIVSLDRRPLHRINRPSRLSLLNIQHRHINIRGDAFVNLQNLSSVPSDSSDPSLLPGHSAPFNR